MGFELAVSVDRPTGRYTAIPSAVTGKTIRYFTPDALGDLLQRTADQRQPAPYAEACLDRAGLLALVPAVARSSADPALVDPALAAALCDAIVAPRAQWSADALLALARPLSSKAQALRQEVIFSGGPDAGSALHVYAPHGELPRLVDELEQGIALPVAAAPGHRAAVAAYFCLDVHPFRDANGRWSRLVTVATARSDRERCSAMICAAFHVAARHDLVRTVFPRARGAGLRQYLALAASFEDALLDELSRNGIASQVAAVTAAVGRASNRQGTATALLASLWSRGRMPHEELRSRLGASAKVARGLASTITQLQGQPPAEDANVRPILGRIGQAIEFAKRRTFEG